MRSLLTILLLLPACTLAAASPPRVHRAIDSDDAYKNNCMRCHTALPAYSPRMNKTIMLHMQQAANIPRDEAEAILRYLNGDPAEPRKGVQPAGAQQLNK